MNSIVYPKIDFESLIETKTKRDFILLLAFYSDSEIDILFEFLFNNRKFARKIIGRSSKSKLRKLCSYRVREISLRKEKVDILINLHSVIAKLAEKIVLNDIVTAL